MTTTVLSLIIAGLCLFFTVFQGIVNMKRNNKADVKADTTDMTTVIIKLENISTGIAEIKSDMSCMKKDFDGIKERLVRVEESSKQAHKRLDELHRGDTV